MPQAISRYEYLVDSVDTLHELPRCDLAILPLSKNNNNNNNNNNNKRKNAYATLQICRIRRRKLHDFAPRIISFHANNLTRTVNADLSYGGRKVRRVLWWWPQTISRNGHDMTLLHLPTKFEM